MDSSEIKRMILAESEHTGIRKKVLDNRDKDGGLNTGDILDIGNALEAMTKSKGWAFIEAYIISRANPVQMLLRDNVTPEEKGAARGLTHLMQYVKSMIEAKDAVLARANAERGSEVQESPAQ